MNGLNILQTRVHRQGLIIGCPEEIAWRMGYINHQQLEDLIKPLNKNNYGKYLMTLLSEN